MNKLKYLLLSLMIISNSAKTSHFNLTADKIFIIPLMGLGMAATIYYYWPDEQDKKIDEHYPDTLTNNSEHQKLKKLTDATNLAPEENERLFLEQKNLQQSGLHKHVRQEILKQQLMIRKTFTCPKVDEVKAALQELENNPECQNSDILVYPIRIRNAIFRALPSREMMSMSFLQRRKRIINTGKTLFKFDDVWIISHSIACSYESQSEEGLTLSFNFQEMGVDPGSIIYNRDELEFPLGKIGLNYNPNFTFSIS